ncbi:bifunctional metallophosphatase/5'-nucleotidase [Legionella quateirensis]|uniref:5'-nucleotidase n=1 Tax=Legionella quateirensis TaxID=45072 RepID=A0A378L4X2_9GAMM|nr:bifunctional metallophosphatase/5'-nucleotidase [Legionella quateirensis]KTD52751.1 5'-nucleotidase [Legionella quateirensis]STY19170.1 5'-nucleotidase [Legionella quateirensis]
MFYNNKLKQLVSALTLIFSVIPFAVLNAADIPSTINPPLIDIKILGINDFHGQISTGRMVKNEPVGGAAVLAAYIKQAQAGMEDRTIITIMGDQVGASPPSSGILHDEPSILFTNSLGNTHCSTEARMNPQCNIVATVGNHEFDKGQKAMFDLIYGTDNPPTDNWISLPNYPGAAYPFISANIVDEKTEKPLFPPYVIKTIHGVPVAFIGAVLKNAAGSMFPDNAKGVKFLDEARTINQYVPKMKAQGAQIIIVLIHEGGNQAPYEGDTKTNSHVEGGINEVIEQLDDDVDVVMAGHTHQFLNAYIPNHHGVNILVTQAYSYSAAIAEVTLKVDAKSHKVKQKSARIITTYANRGPGTQPDEKALQLVKLAEDTVEPIINSYIGTAQNTLSRKQNNEGESNLGNLVADAFKAEMDADIGMTNPSSMRDDIKSGIVNWGHVYAVLPFGNTIVNVTLTGQDLYDLFEQQWMGPYDNMLQISGLTYSYDPAKPVGHKVITIHHQNKPLIKSKTYTIATNNFLATGGGVFSVMARGTIIKVGESDQDTVMNYIKKLPQPFTATIEGRIQRVS